MRKTAIFVEGQTELVFVREYLLKWFDYSDISLECYTLFTDSNFHSTEYSFPNETAENFFQIINVGNDNAVLTRILNREQHLWNVGFNRIIGLRDMYSKQYRELLTQAGQIDLSLNEEFKDATKKEITSRSNQADSIDFCFAVMECESWILGFHNCFETINPLLTTDYIENQLGFNLEKVDPEVTFFHPARIMEDIYALAGENYKKSKGNISKIMAALQKEDFECLVSSSKCSSFETFVTYFQK
jgi:hypothetical protein